MISPTIDDVVNAWTKMHQRIDFLESEVQRLRNALSTIAGDGPSAITREVVMQWSLESLVDYAVHDVMIAHAALEGK